MRIAFRGNFRPAHSTETHLGLSLEALGHDVIRLQEDTVDWGMTVDAARVADAFCWTSTFGYAHLWDQGEAYAAVDKLNGMLPTFAVHLDRFVGLTREPQIHTEPWFRLRHVFTADGGSQDVFAAAGINHHWSPPGVFHGEATDERRSGRYRSELAFVGSWESYGHPEHEPYRLELLDHLREWYRQRFKCWPRGPAIRGLELNRLYASHLVSVGDSCLANGAKRYWSDRCTEAIGRGGFLIHPEVEGLSEIHPYIWTWPLGDWDALHGLIERALSDPKSREEARREAAADVRANHTYRRRLEVILETVMS